MALEDIDAGRVEGTTSAEKRELVALCRRTLGLQIEIKMPERAWAYFARKNVLSRGRARGSAALADADSRS